MTGVERWNAFNHNGNNKPGGGGKGEPSDATGSQSDKAEQCCIGLLEITATVIFHDNTGSRTSLGYDATIQVDTVTKCEPIECEDVTGRSDKVPTDGVSDRHTVYTTFNICDDMVKKYNRGTDYTGDRFDNITKPDAAVSGTVLSGLDRDPTAKLGKPYSFKLMKAKKLGCCDYPCPVQHTFKVHDHKGRVPGAPHMGVVKAETVTDMVDQIRAKFGFGGSVAKPTFKPCCKKKKGTNR